MILAFHIETAEEEHLLLTNPTVSPGTGFEVVAQVGPQISFLWKTDSDLCVSKKDQAGSVIYSGIIKQDSAELVLNMFL